MDVHITSPGILVAEDLVMFYADLAVLFVVFCDICDFLLVLFIWYHTYTQTKTHKIRHKYIQDIIRHIWIYEYILLISKIYSI